MSGKLGAAMVVTSVVAGLLTAAGNFLSGSAEASVWRTTTVDAAGDVGSSTSIAVDGNGYAHISYYDVTNSDLKYARWDGSRWIIQTVDSGGRVGWESSIALDSNDYAHISYMDQTNWNLKYANWTGSAWRIRVVDSTRGTGEYSSLALDRSGYPQISHYSGLDSRLHYANWSGTAWSYQVLSSTGGEYSSLALDRNDYPHIGYFDRGIWGIIHAYWNGTAWRYQTVAILNNMGCPLSMALDSNDYPRFAYCDATSWTLKYSRWNGSAWRMEVVDTLGNNGRWLSLALYNGDYPYIAYYDTVNQDLKYARWNGTGWRIETIDSGGDVGRWPSIFVDSNEYSHISYYDVTNGDLEYVGGVGNDPPHTPSAFSGPTSGIVGIQYAYFASTTDPDGDRVKYTFDWGDGNASETAYVDSGLGASLSHNWSWAGTYYVIANATDVHGESSAWTGMLAVDIIGPPGAPGNFSASAGDSFVLLSWAAPSYDGRSPITNYTIYRGVASEAETLLTTVGNTFTHMDTGLVNGRTYYYKVSAVNGVGEGPLSGEANETPLTVPGPPVNLTTVSLIRNVTLSWEAPLDDGGTSVTNYTLYRTGGPPPGTPSRFDLGNLLAFTDTSVVPTYSYEYNVTAKNRVGEGQPSNTLYIVPIGAPSPPIITGVVPGDSQVTLTWQEPLENNGSAVTGYTIYRGTAFGAETVLTSVPYTGTSETFVDSVLANGQTYCYYVTARNAAGEGTRSNEVSATPATVPGAPTGLTAVAGDGRVTLSWSAPADDGGSPITDYAIWRSTVSGGETFLKSVGKVLSCVDSGLTNGQTYYYKVSARNAIGNGPNSTEAFATPATVPSEPLDLEVETVWDTITGEGFLRLTWTMPVFDGGSPITNYRIYRRNESSGESFLAEVGNLLEYNDTAVAIGQKYHYRVRAVNAIGEGPNSIETSGMLTPRSPPPGPKSVFEELWFWSLIIAIVVAVVVILILVMKRKKKGKEASGGIGDC